MSKIVAIHQPNFIPWLGFFDKLHRADIFIMLDNVQFPKKGGNWINRVKMLVSGTESWITIPVDRKYHGFLEINQMMIENKSDWRSKILKSIYFSYKKTFNFECVFKFFEELINYDTDSLVEYNLHALNRIIRALMFDNTEIYYASSLIPDVDNKKSDLLIDLIHQVNGDGYLYGAGSSYLEEDKFKSRGLPLIRQDFSHPVYEQAGLKTFVPGLSIMDTFFNLGFDKTRELLDAQSY